MIRPDDMLETLSDLAAAEPDLMRFMLQAVVASLLNSQSGLGGDAEIKRKSATDN